MGLNFPKTLTLYLID